MDIQTLSELFSRTLSADPNARKAAELEIRRVWTRLSRIPITSVLICVKVGRQEGMVSALLQIIQNEGLDACVIKLILPPHVLSLMPSQCRSSSFFCLS